MGIAFPFRYYAHRALVASVSHSHPVSECEPPYAAIFGPWGPIGRYVYYGIHKSRKLDLCGRQALLACGNSVVITLDYGVLLHLGICGLKFREESRGRRPRYEGCIALLRAVQDDASNAVLDAHTVAAMPCSFTLVCRLGATLGIDFPDDV